MSVVAGIDEAGRGPLIGPMVVAIACADPVKLKWLEALGVKDSKLVSPGRREKIQRALDSVLDYSALRVVPPDEIDKAVQRVGFASLNELELRVMAELVLEARKSIPVEKVYVDSPDPVPERFGRRLSELIGGGVEVVAENHADRKYIIVSAASIIAKAERERIVSELKKIYGDFGSGYPSDPKTRRFVAMWIEREGAPPPIVRRSWSTLKNLK